MVSCLHMHGQTQTQSATKTMKHNGISHLLTECRLSMRSFNSVNFQGFNKFMALMTKHPPIAGTNVVLTTYRSYKSYSIQLTTLTDCEYEDSKPASLTSLEPQNLPRTHKRPRSKKWSASNRISGFAKRAHARMQPPQSSYNGYQIMLGGGPQHRM